MSRHSSLRIAILGGGNIGSTLAFQLAGAGGHDVTVVARPRSARLQQLLRDRAIVKPGGARSGVHVGDALDPGMPYDLVIVTVPLQQQGVLVPALQRSAAARILFMVNQFDPARVRDLVGAARCDFGMPFVQARLDVDGRLDAVIGAGGQQTRLGNQRWVELFKAAGLPAVFEPAMPLWLRCHAPLCVAFESISVAAVRRGGGASWARARVLARGMHASYDLIAHLGDRPYPGGKARLKASPEWVAALALWAVSRIPSFRTLLAKGEHECRALVDSMVAEAMRAAPAADVTSIAAMKPPHLPAAPELG